MWVVLAAAVSGDAAACAGFVHGAEELAESSWQEAIFERIEGGVQVEYEVDLLVDTADFGWVIPIPGAFRSAADGDAGRFEALYAETGAELDLEEVESRGCAATDLGMNSKSGGLSDSAGGVEEIYSGSTPTYDVTVVAADDPAALDAWLGEHGWEIGAASASIAEYVQEGGWQFVAVSLRLDAVEGATGLELPPLRLQYDGDRMVFPSRMGRYAEVDEIRTMVYVVGDQRARVSGGWGQEDLSEVRDEGESPGYMEYSAYPEAVQRAGSDGKLALTWAGPADAAGGAWVSRFELDAPTSMHTVDAAFALDAGTEPLRLVISNRAAGGCGAGGEGALLLVPALLYGARRGRRAA